MRPPAAMGASVRQEVERLLDAGPARDPAPRVPTWRQEPIGAVGVGLRRLGAGRSHGDDGPGLPRTNTAMEPFYRHLKAGERRATGHRRSATFGGRSGGLAADAAAASTRAEREIRNPLATVSAHAGPRRPTRPQAVAHLPRAPDPDAALPSAA
jgi:hypothetical protein